MAHKTGTVGDVINDVGVITLPGGRGHAIVTVFVQSRASSEDRDAAIAQLARAARLLPVRCLELMRLLSR